MNLVYPKHFSVKEFVPEEVYQELGDRSLILMDSRIVKTADQIREYFGIPMHINTWCFGGDRNYSGFRPTGCRVGAKWSQHRFGRAVDIISGVSAKEMRNAILDNAEDFPYITAIETDVDWLHVDCRNIDPRSEFYLFKG